MSRLDDGPAPIGQGLATPNPYAPPKADVADVVDRGRAVPPLWNPNAAASWSLLFSPAFGAFLHMKNWQALGEPAKAATARTWFVVTLCGIVGVSLVSAFLPEAKAVDALSRIVALGLLLSWYFASARAQVAYVKGRFGTGYPRRGWLKPLLIAIVALVGLMALAIALLVVVERVHAA